ncbi:MAG TPA: hypothetical protein VNN08_20100 [Thermoanaerobaculia bacterium]|nr:hypothetical protein [Thermoanaerobaculia bacterium]
MLTKHVGRMTFDNDVREEIEGGISLPAIDLPNTEKAPECLKYLRVDQMRRCNYVTRAEDNIGQGVGGGPNQQEINQRGRVDNNHQSRLTARSSWSSRSSRPLTDGVRARGDVGAREVVQTLDHFLASRQYGHFFCEVGQVFGQ